MILYISRKGTGRERLNKKGKKERIREEGKEREKQEGYRE